MTIEDYNRLIIKNLLPTLGFDSTDRLFICDFYIAICFHITYIELIFGKSLSGRKEYHYNSILTLACDNIALAFKNRLVTMLQGEVNILQTQSELIKEKINTYESFRL